MLLTRNTTIPYVDKNDSTVTETLPDLEISVNKYMLDSAVATDKAVYTANEQATVTNTAKNLTEYATSLNGKVEILDSEGNLVECLTDTAVGTWEAGETKTFTFSWNTGKTITGTYKARVTWSEGSKVISVAQTGFDIVADAEISGTVTVDKVSYTAGEEVHITETINNNSTNSIEAGLNVVTGIKDPNGTEIWGVDNSLPEILPAEQTGVNNAWNTGTYAPGRYIVTMDIFEGTTKLAESSTSFNIVSAAEGIYGITADIDVIQNFVYPADAVEFKYTANNTGNVALNDVMIRIRIVETATETILGTVSDTINLDIQESRTALPLSVSHWLL